ncbi:MAG: hypothetical protein IKN30_04990 [Synergistaceae bacterium]|nr:hypothetical protein [Synergistaceae bacterium]
MDRKNLEQYLGKNIEIMLMPDGRKTSGILLKCEDDHIALGDELWVYPMIWGVKPIQGEPEIKIPAPAEEPEPVPVIEEKPAPEPEVIKFQDELEKIFSDMRENLETYTLNADYVRKFRTKGQSKIQSIIESILTKYQYAVKTHEDRPYSMRMREILNTAYNLWKNNKNIAAVSEIYAFVLYLTGESEKSVKLYMKIHDFHGAFMAASSAASKILASACLAVSEPLTPKNFATLLKMDPPHLAAVLKWIIDNTIEKDSEIEFTHVAALSQKILGFQSWQNKETLFTEENIKALREWLDTRQSDDKIIEDAIKLSAMENLPQPEEKSPVINWSEQRLEGEFEFFNPNRDKLYGFIKCPVLKKYNIPLSSENSVFVHFFQIQDRGLRRKLLAGKKMHPLLKVTFKLGHNSLGPAAFDVREKNYDIENVLKVDMQSALAEEGTIDFFRRHDDIPFGKVRTKSGELFTFNENNISDPLLMVFLEYSPSAEGLPVRFTRGILNNEKVQIHNLEAAVPFPEDKIKAWQKGGLIDKARKRVNGMEEADSVEEEEFYDEITPEIEELINRDYVALEPYAPAKDRQFISMENPPAEQEQKGVDTFDELPKFLQDKILSVSIAGKCSTEFLGDTFYRRGHFKEVKANYLQLVSRFNSEDSTLTNAERAERCFLIARYVYNFFALADDVDIRLYSAADEENIRIMAYKGLEYLIYAELDGAKKNDENYDTARRYCLLRINEEIQTTRHIDDENTWFRIYICSYFVNGLRFHSRTGKWSPQDISLAGSSLLECNDFKKFFEGILALAYVTEPALLEDTIVSLMYNPEYAGSLLKELGINSSDGILSKNPGEYFEKAVEEYAKRKDIFSLDPDVKLSPEIFKILSIQSALIKLIKRELPHILRTSPEKLDDALKKANPILDTEEYQNSLAKTRKKYNPDAGLLDILPINVLGKILGQYWWRFSTYFDNKPFASYWEERFEKLQWVRNPVFHAHPEYVKKEDVEKVQSICQEVAACLANAERD